MLRDAWFIGLQDAKHLLRRRETLMWTFIMPLVFFFFIGSATGGFSSGGGREAPTPVTLVAPADAGFLVDEVAARLAARGYAVTRAAPGDSVATTRRVILPARFTDSLVAARPTVVWLEAGAAGAGPGMRFDQVRVTRALYSTLADVMTVVAENRTPTAATVAEVRTAPRLVGVQVSAAGRRHDIPTGFAQAVPGTMVMFTLLVMLTSSAVLLVIERREGLLRRLAATPITRGSLVLGKWIGRMLLGCVQVGYAMLAGALLFKMNWGSELPTLLLLLLVYAGFNASLGLVLGSVTASQGQAVAIGVLSANVLAALGGCWWPIEVTPEWMQRFALVLPTGIAMNGVHQLVSFGAPGSAAWPHIAVLAAAALAAGALATRWFRYQ